MQNLTMLLYTTRIFKKEDLQIRKFLFRHQYNVVKIDI